MFLHTHLSVPFSSSSAEKHQKKEEVRNVLKSVALDQQKSWSHALQRLVRLWYPLTFLYVVLTVLYVALTVLYIR